MSKVIFLDVDGVLNSKRFAEYCTNNEGLKNWWSYGLLEQELLFNLYHIVKTFPDCHIVLCSSWRISSHHKELLDRQLALYGMGVYGTTTANPKMGRGQQIMEWVYNHEDVDNFVVLDDDNDIRDYPPETEVSKHLVWVSFLTGLTAENADEAIRILKGE